MKIKYLGHSSFSIKGKTNTGEEVTLITDPFDKKDVGIPYSKQNADIVTISHKHPDHNHIKNIEGIFGKDYYLIDSPGEYEIKGLRIFGIRSYHDDKNGTERGLNTIFIFDFQEARIAHLGDLGHRLDSNQLESLEHIDILMLPIGGKFTIDAKLAMQTAEAIEPSIIIPMHYKTLEHLDMYNELLTLEDFLKETGSIETSTRKDLVIKSKSDLPSNITISPIEISA